MDNPVTFAAWLKRERLRAGLTQEQLADRTGFDDSYINKVERGHIRLPTLESRQRLHHVLGTTEEDLKAVGLVNRAGRSNLVAQPLQDSSSGDDPADPTDDVVMLNARDLTPEGREVLAGIIESLKQTYPNFFKR